VPEGLQPQWCRQVWQTWRWWEAGWLQPQAVMPQRQCGGRRGCFLHGDGSKVSCCLNGRGTQLMQAMWAEKCQCAPGANKRVGGGREAVHAPVLGGHSVRWRRCSGWEVGGSRWCMQCMLGGDCWVTAVKGVGDLQWTMHENTVDCVTRAIIAGMDAGGEHGRLDTVALTKQTCGASASLVFDAAAADAPRCRQTPPACSDCPPFCTRQHFSMGMQNSLLHDGVQGTPNRCCGVLFCTLGWSLVSALPACKCL
jgi:hypothetical protein